MRRKKLVFRIAGVGLLLAGLSLTSCVTYSSLYFADHEGLSIDGYDPVSYFSDGEPAVGDSRFRYDWTGTTWQFKSQENLDLFKAEPDRYAPQYGGYCAWAAARNKLAPVNPEIWTIVDGKLYLNRNEKVQKEWEANRERDIELADRYWPELRTGLQP